MASTLSFVLSRLGRTLGATLMAARLPARSSVCWPGELPLAWLAGWLAGCFGSRLLEKPDSSCAKLCFPSRVYVPTHFQGENNVGYSPRALNVTLCVYACTYICAAETARLPVTLRFAFDRPRFLRHGRCTLNRPSVDTRDASITYS